MLPARALRLLLTMALVAAVVAAGAAIAAAKNPEAELNRVRARIEQLQRDVRADLERRNSLAVELRESEAAVLAARQRLTEARRQVAASDARLRELETERRRNEGILERERDTLAAQLRAAYVNGREEQLKLLLGQKDPAALGRMLVYYSYLGRARAAKIGEIEEAVRQLESLAKSLADERAHYKELATSAAAEVQSLDAARDRREQALAAMTAQIKGRNDAIARLRREAQGLEKLIEDLRRALREAPPPLEGGQPFERVRGQLPWPVSGRLTARFGESRGGGLKWTGVVIATDRGTQVRAPYGGRVVYADWLPGLGLLLILDHGGGYLTLYGHNEQLFKAVGDAVGPGEVIGTVGDSGGQERPELYVEVRKGSRALDPRLWFRRGGP